MVDVGAERGAFAAEMLRAGSDAVHVIEPEPSNANYLRQRFRDHARVTVHECAVTDRDTELELHMAVDQDGRALTFGHTLLERPATHDIAWERRIKVAGRSLGSLVEAGELPRRVAILKVDTEGHDLAVVGGMGRLECDVVMVEHWSELPKSLGPCPWTADEMASALASHGFSHFAAIVHRADFTFLKWDDGGVRTGDWANIVFLHDSVLRSLLPEVLASSAALAENAVAVGQMYASEAAARLAVIEELDRAREQFAAAAAERLARLEELERELQRLSG